MHHMRLSKLAVVLLILGAANCGSPCSRLSAADDAIYQKGKACGTLDTTWNKSKADACEAALPKCTAADLKLYEDYAACQQKIPVCSEGQFFSFNASRLECSAPLSKLTASCLFF